MTFSSSAADLVVRDTLNGTTTRVSADSAGIEGNSNSVLPVMSGDGRFVAFQSAASNLVAGDTNSVTDVLVRDTLKGTTTRVSVDSTGLEANGESINPSISADGRYVSFVTGATNLAANDLNGVHDVVIRAIPEVTVISITPDQLTVGTTTAVTITGTNFLAGSTPVVGSAQVGNTVIVNENTITASVTVPAGTTAGDQDVSVGIPGTGPGPSTGATGTCTGCMTFAAPPGCG